MDQRANMRNPAVKRIMQEMREMQKETSRQFSAEPLESNIFEWIFAIRGPRGSAFEGGVYIGRIILPHNYPMAPPSFIFVTPNGRFERGMKVCLSISHYHPEEWQPSWGIRTALTALIPFMVTPASGAIGSLDCPDDERRNLAHASRQRPPEMGSDESQQIATRMHRKIMETEAEAEGYDEGEKEAAPESSEPGGGNSRDSDGAKEDSPAASDSGKVQTDSETPEQTPAGLQKAQESPSLGTRRADHGGSSSPDSNPGVDLASGPSGLPPGAASESQQAGSSRTSASMGASSHTILRPRAPPAPPASDMRAPAASPSDRRAAPVAARAGVGQERLGNGRSAEIQGGVAGRRAGVEEPGVPRGGVRAEQGAGNAARRRPVRGIVTNQYGFMLRPGTNEVDRVDAALTVTLYALLFSIVALAGNIMGRMAAIELPLER